MEPRDRYNDPLEQLITEALHEQVGPPPSAVVWERILGEIAPSPKAPPWQRLHATLLSLFRAPLAQSALVLTLMVIIFVQPAYYWMNQEYSVSTTTSPSAPPPTSHKERFLPDSEANDEPIVPSPSENEPPLLELQASGLGGVQQ